MRIARYAKPPCTQHPSNNNLTHSYPTNTPFVRVTSLPTYPIYSVIIVALDQQYQAVAHWLTERENYRTDLQFQDSLIAKLVVFQFINNFSALYHIAFVKKSLEGACDGDDCGQELAWTLLSIFVWRLLVMGNLKELLVPALKAAYRKYDMKKEKVALLKRSKSQRSFRDIQAKKVAEANAKEAEVSL